MNQKFSTNLISVSGFGYSGSGLIIDFLNSSNNTVFSPVEFRLLKDVDGFNPINVGNLSLGYQGIVPCTPMGSLLLIKRVEKNLSGKHAVIIGRSNLNGKPMAQLLLKEDCTVTVVHSKTKDLKAECQKADILVVAVGEANLVKKIG